MNEASDRSLFPLGGPVEPDDLVGREAYIDTLVRRLGSRQSLMIAAPRRLGKTSVVDEALRRLVDQDCYTARVDLFAVTSRAELAEELADRCLENRTRLRRSIQAVRSFARATVGAFKPSVTIQDVELSLSLGRESASENQVLRDALSLPQRLAEHDRKRMIIAWDEFQEVTRLNGRDEDEVLRIMRAELQRQTGVSHVFLGSQESMLRGIFGHTSQAFYRFAAELPFPPAPGPDEWVPYLQRKYASRDVAISRSDAARLVAFAGGHPLDTMLCANNVYQIALELALTDVTSVVIESAFERTMDELARSFDELWTELGERADARLVVRRLAMQQPVTSGGAGRRLHQQQAQLVLAFLQRRGIVVREGRANYRFIEPMFAEYVRRLFA